MKIKSLLVMPEKEVQLVRIPASLKFIKSLIGAKLIRIKLDDDTIILANKNAPREEYNRIVGQYIVRGSFLVIAMKNGRRTSLKKRQIKRYVNRFDLTKHKKKIDLYKNNFINKYLENVKPNKLKENITETALKVA